MFGTEFRKINKNTVDRFKTVDIQKDEHNLSFSLPKTAKHTWNGQTFTATFPNKESTQLQLAIADLKDNSFDTYVQEVTNNQTITAKGSVLSKVLKNGIWTEQTVYTKQVDGTQQQLIVTYQDPISQKQVNAFLSNPYGAFTVDLQEIMMHFHETISF